MRCRGVAVVLLKQETGQYKVLLMKRANPPRGAWCYIGGSIEPNEQAWEAALREIREETGITEVALFSANVCEQFYQVDRDSVWFAPVFVAYMHDSKDVVLNSEHTEFCWLDFDQAREKVSFPGNDLILNHIEKHYAKKHPPEWLRVTGPQA